MRAEPSYLPPADRRPAHDPAAPVPIAASDLLASRRRRFLALCIDLSILLVPAIVVAVLVATAVLSDEMTAQEEDDATFLVVALVFLAATALYLFAYLPLTMSRAGARNGQTLGKQALGVRVVTAEGLPVTYGRVLRRELLGTWLINWVTGLYSIVDYGFGLFDGRRQCLHDKIGSTYVFKEQIPFGDGRPPLARGEAAVVAATQPEASTPPPVPPVPSAQPVPGGERPQHRWSPPTERRDDGNDEARRAFGDG